MKLMASLKRQLSNLRTAAPCGKPKLARGRGASGVVARGKAYEGRVLRVLGRLLPASAKYLPRQWFRYVDDRGLGFCEADAVVLFPHVSIVIECKLSWTPDALEELGFLYGPVIRRAYRKPTAFVEVFRSFRRGHNMEVQTKPDFESIQPGETVSWNCLA